MKILILAGFGICSILNFIRYFTKGIIEMKKLSGLAILWMISISSAQAIDFGVGVKAGINGIGLDLSVGLTETVNLRFTNASIDIDDEDESIEVGDDGAESDIDAELEFDYGATALLIDWHVFNSGFRVTAGMMRNDGGVDISGVLQSDIIIDGEPLSQDDIRGDIGGEVDLADDFQPYIGIGWGRGAGGDGGLSFSFDVGVAMLDIEVDYEASVDTGGPNGYDQAELNQRLADLESDSEDELDDYELWPVLAFGVNYAF